MPPCIRPPMASHDEAAKSPTAQQDISSHQNQKSFQPAVVHNVVDDDDDSPKKSSSALDGAEIGEITKSETMEEIEEAWEEATASGELVLTHLSLDRYAIEQLLQKWNQLWRFHQQAQNSPNQQHSGHEMIRKVLLEACSFPSMMATNLFLHFLQQLSKSGLLKEVFIVDTYLFNDTYLVDERAASLLRVLPRLAGLERLAVDKADLRGRSLGIVLHNLLLSPTLRTLRLNDCQIDDEMLQPFLEGVQAHGTGLCHLDLDGWYMNDEQVKLLIEALTNSPSANTLEFLDLSRSDMTASSLGSLALLLRKSTALRELVLVDCKDLFQDVEVVEGTRPANSLSSGFLQFAHELRRSRQLQELRMDGLTQELAGPLLDAQPDGCCRVLNLGDNISFLL